MEGHLTTLGNYMNQSVTDFLVPRSSVLTGMGTLLNMAGSYYFYNVSPNPAEADSRALASDWKIIGEDFRQVLSEEKKRFNDTQLQLAL
jgi:hypothetical protein